MCTHLEAISGGNWAGSLTRSPMVLPGQRKFTCRDALTTRNRHAMYNVGYLNGILRGLGLPESDWYSCNEGED